MNPLETCAISSCGLTRHFGAVKAVEDLHLEVPGGGISAFLGPNGSGKTTTIRLLLGLLKPTSGTCEVLGRPAGDLDSLSRIGAVVENPSLYPHLTGRENLEITRLLRACPHHRVDDVLAVVGLREAADRPTQGYSLGMKQRLSLALALLHEPELLILDEPTNGLDPAGIREMRELIRDLPKRTGATVFLSTHMLAEAEQVADHVVILAQGRIRFQGSPQEMKARTASRLEVLCGDPAGAMVCLAALGMTGERLGDRLLLDTDRAQTPLIAERLVGAGIPLFGLTLQEAHFEDLFMSLTEAS
ncbi:MAG TPA: ABC transporter ATP-binding protein [Geothrix sp.]|nr:ABC transporter ATP-binding protein [Geothrix sp.]